jgi:hypothetical protein
LKRRSKATKNKDERKIKNKIQTQKNKETDKTRNKKMKDGTRKGTHKGKKRLFYNKFFWGKQHSLTSLIPEA